MATATRAELEAASTKDEVWYEFQPGDVVPFHVGFFGAMAGALQQPTQVQAKKAFYFVMRKNAPAEVSFDGKSFARSDSSQYMFLVLPGDGEKGGKVAWMNYIGESGDPRQELQSLLEEEKNQKPHE